MPSGNELLPKNKSILAVFAHPDDEAFGPGGTLALLSDTNRVTLICVTDGGLPERKRELQASAKILGIQELVFLDYPDGSLNNAVYHRVAGDIQQIVDRIKPEMLLTFEPRGISGHLDHVAVSMITSYVFRENKKIKQIWYFGELENRVMRIFRNHYFIFFPEGYKREEMDVMIETSKVYPTQVKAMRAHKSQKADADRLILARKLLPKEEGFLITRL